MQQYEVGYGDYTKEKEEESDIVLGVLGEDGLQIYIDPAVPISVQEFHQMIRQACPGLWAGQKGMGQLAGEAVRLREVGQV